MLLPVDRIASSRWRLEFLRAHIMSRKFTETIVNNRSRHVQRSLGRITWFVSHRILRDASEKWPREQANLCEETLTVPPRYKMIISHSTSVSERVRSNCLHSPTRNQKYRIRSTALWHALGAKHNVYTLPRSDKNKTTQKCSLDEINL